MPEKGRKNLKPRKLCPTQEKANSTYKGNSLANSLALQFEPPPETIVLFSQQKLESSLGNQFDQKTFFVIF